MNPQPSSGRPQGGVLVPPPAVLHESVPAPRPGYAWLPGYWDWKNDHHVWIAGQWVPARLGCHWRRHRWILRAGHWFLERGAWVLDEREGARAPVQHAGAPAP
jgi:hypothetical protein